MLGMRTTRSRSRRALPTHSLPFRCRPPRSRRAEYSSAAPPTSWRLSPILAIRLRTISPIERLFGTAGARTVRCPDTSLTWISTVAALSIITILLRVEPGRFEQIGARDGLVAAQHLDLAGG